MTGKTWLISWYIARRFPKEAEKMLGKNWKTSIGGIGMYLAAIAAIIHCFICQDCGSKIECIVAAIGLLSGGSGLIAAKDHDVTGGTVSQ